MNGVLVWNSTLQKSFFLLLLIAFNVMYNMYYSEFGRLLWIRRSAIDYWFPVLLSNTVGCRSAATAPILTLFYCRNTVWRIRSGEIITGAGSMPEERGKKLL